MSAPVKDIAVLFSAVVPNAGLLYAVHRFKSDDDAAKFILHPAFALAGVSTLFSGVYIAGMPKSKYLMMFHGAINFLGAFSLLKGVNVMYQIKQDNNKSHFETPHAWIGLAASFLVVTQAISGAYSFYLTAPEKRKEAREKHPVAGSVATTLLAFAASAGAFAFFEKKPLMQAVGLVAPLAAAALALRKI